MKIALVIYVVIYLSLMTTAIVDDFKSKEPWWDTASDALLLPLGFVGIMLYAYGVPDPKIKLLWQVLAPAIIAGQLSSNLIGRHSTMQQVQVTRDERWVGDIVTTVVLLPMFVINAAYAFH